MSVPISLAEAVRMQPKYQYPREHLRLYLEEIQLPPILFATPDMDTPPIPQPGESLLSATPDSRRRLRVIISVGSGLMNKRITKFIRSNIPTQYRPIDARYGQHMTFTAPSFSTPTRADFEWLPPVAIGDMRRMSQWVYRVVGTVRRAMEMVWPEHVRRFCLTTICKAALREDPDGELYTAWYWTKNWGVEDGGGECKVVISIVAPWAMGPEDMKSFCTGGKFPTFTIVKDNNNRDKLGDPPSFNRVHKIWAKIWDDCMRKRCPFFVVTVYNTWFFGVFTRGWGTAMVSDPIPLTASKPSVLHWLLFWFASSMGFRNTWTPPNLNGFHNLDIKNAANVATQLSGAVDKREGLVEKNEEWLDKNLKEHKKFGRTRVVPELPNTWITSFSN